MAVIEKELCEHLQMDKYTFEVLVQMLTMTGSEIYNKYGLKRDEKLYYPVFYKNEYEMDIELIIGDENDTPYMQTVLIDNSNRIIAFSEPEFEFKRQWHLEDKGIIYTIIVDVEEN